MNLQYKIIDRQTGKLLTETGSITQAIKYLETEKPKDVEIRAVPARSQNREVCHGL